MSKIICDICGTSYPETADQCPICGCAKDMTAESLLGEYVEEEVTETVQERPKGGRFAASNVRKRKPRVEEEYEDDEDEDDEYEEDDDEDEEEEKSNAPLVVLLVIVIVALLAVTGFIFVKYFMPNMMPEETTAPTTVATTQAPESTEAAVPCTSLVLTSGTDIALEDVGFSKLINVSALPENTTDRITFTSSDESVAVVGEDGTVTAVGEGTAVITITCGTEQLTCSVVCEFTPETTVPETTAAETTVPETTVPETTVPETTLPNVTISFVKSDVTSRMIGEQFPLKVNPSDLDPTLITWSSENERICTVDETGLVTIKGRGTTHVYAEYNGQKIECIVRVI